MRSALSYDLASKHLYKGVAGSSDCLFAEPDKKTINSSCKIAIPEEPVEIVISSKGVSYLYAKILIKGKALLNFQDKQALYLVNYYSLDTFHVPAGNWDELFNIIVSNYNNLYYTSESDIENYFNELDTIVLKESVFVFRNKINQSPVEWKGSFLVLLHSVNILSSIINCKKDSVIGSNPFFEERLLSTCRKYMQRFATCYPTWDIKEGDSRLDRFSKRLFDVCKYIEQHGKPFELIDFFVKLKQ